MNAFILHCDDNYFQNHAKYCIASLLCNEIENANIFLYGINLSPKSIQFLKELKRLSININYENYCSDRDIPRGQMTHFKGIYLYRIVNEYNVRNLIYLDSDSIIFKSLGTYWSLLEDNDLFVHLRSQYTHPDHRYSSAFWGIKSSPIMRMFLEYYGDLCSKDIGKFTQDQNSLTLAIEKYKKELKICYIGNEFLHWGNCIRSVGGIDSKQDDQYLDRQKHFYDMAFKKIYILDKTIF